MCFQMSDIYRRSLIFVVLQKASGYEKNIGELRLVWDLRVSFSDISFCLAIGAVEIYFGKFNFDQSYSGWYPLFPAFSMGIDTSAWLSPWLIFNRFSKRLAETELTIKLSIVKLVYLRRRKSIYIHGLFVVHWRFIEISALT